MTGYYHIHHGDGRGGMKLKTKEDGGLADLGIEWITRVFHLL